MKKKYPGTITFNLLIAYKQQCFKQLQISLSCSFVKLTRDLKLFIFSKLICKSPGRQIRKCFLTKHYVPEKYRIFYDEIITNLITNGEISDTRDLEMH